jgi:hypothetical protein
MKTLLRIEEAFLFLLAVFLFSRTGYAWWWFPLLLFAPDAGMLGYLLNPKLGAWVYNFIHHRALAIALYVLGVLLPVPALQLAGVILFAHSSLDRVLDFGLKYGDRFAHTHLGTGGSVGERR